MSGSGVGQTRADAAAVGFRSDRGPVLISLMLSTALVALDSTILATAVPSIVAELSGFTQFPWLFSMYLLTQAVTVPVYSKLADTVGRKPIMLIGIGLFLLGSILCGFSWDMTSLIVFRGVQGLGAGAIQPVSMTIAGDIYTVAERAKAQGYLASVWGISAVVGPALGGVFTQFLSWRWIFFINIPLCLLAVWMLLRSLHEPGERRHHRIDYAGAVLLTTAASLVVLGLLEGGHAWAWDSPVGIGVFVLAGVLLVAFALVERRAAEPVLPLSVFTSRTIVSATVISLLIGTVIIGITSYGPAYLQEVLGYGPLAAGFAIAALTLGWPLAAAQSGRLYLRFGFRVTALIGSVIAVIGTFWVVLWTPHTSLWQVAAVCFVIGRRDGAHQLSDDDRRPGQRRLVPARGRHRRDHVRQVDRQCRRGRGVRRHGQRRRDRRSGRPARSRRVVHRHPSGLRRHAGGGRAAGRRVPRAAQAERPARHRVGDARSAGLR